VKNFDHIEKMDLIIIFVSSTFREILGGKYGGC
jgi:hypothetical protein